MRPFSKNGPKCIIFHSMGMLRLEKDFLRKWISTGERRRGDESEDMVFDFLFGGFDGDGDAQRADVCR